MRCMADHNVIMISYRLKGKLSTPLDTLGRNWEGFEDEKIRRRIRLVNWNPVMDTQDMIVANYEFQSRFLKVLDDIAPMRKVQARRKRSTWVSRTTKEKMKMRDRHIMMWLLLDGRKTGTYTRN